MITTIDLHRAVQETLSAKYPIIEFEGSDDEAPTRPSFYVNYMSGVDTRIACAMERKSATFEVVYYASSSKDNYRELLNKKDELEHLFKMPLETAVNGEYLAVDVINTEFNIDKKNGVLSAIIDVEITQGIDEDLLNNAYSRYDKARNTNTEMIESLTQNGNK